VYVPVVGSVRASTKPPNELKVVAGASAEPFGLRIEIFVGQQPGPTERLMRWPAVPANVSSAFCPGTLVEAVAGAPPTTMDPVVSAGTL
jgi:hypothetical protein